MVGDGLDKYDHSLYMCGGSFRYNVVKSVCAKLKHDNTFNSTHLSNYKWLYCM